MSDLCTECVVRAVHNKMTTYIIIHSMLSKNSRKLSERNTIKIHKKNRSCMFTQTTGQWLKRRVKGVEKRNTHGALKLRSTLLRGEFSPLSRRRRIDSSTAELTLTVHTHQHNDAVNTTRWSKSTWKWTSWWVLHRTHTADKSIM